MKEMQIIICSSGYHINIRVLHVKYNELNPKNHKKRIKPVIESGLEAGKNELQEKSGQKYSRTAADRDHKKISVDPGNYETYSEGCGAGPYIVRDRDDRREGHDRQGDIGHIK